MPWRSTGATQQSGMSGSSLHERFATQLVSYRLNISPPRPDPIVAAAASIPRTTDLIDPPYFFLLKDSKVDGENDVDLASLFSQRRVNLPAAGKLPSHPETDGFHGKNYFSKLDADESLPKPLRALCGSHKLAVNPTLSEESIQNLEEKLRFIAYRCRQGNSEYREKIGICSIEALECCDDRTSQFVSQMYGLAVIDELNSNGGENVKEDLFNLGAAYARLDLVREVTLQAISEEKDSAYSGAFSADLCAKRFNPAESVEAVLTLEHALQDRLLLPTKHVQHRFGHLYGLSQSDIDEIAQVVESKLLENYADRVIVSLSQWDPWIAFMDTDQGFLSEVARIRDEQVELLETISSDTAVSEHERLKKIDDCQKKFEREKADVLYSETKGYFLNHRVDSFLRNSKRSDQAPLIKGLDLFVSEPFPQPHVAPLGRQNAYRNAVLMRNNFDEVIQSIQKLLTEDDGKSVPTMFELVAPGEGHPNQEFNNGSIINDLLERFREHHYLDLPFKVGPNRLVSAERTQFWKSGNSEERAFLLVFENQNVQNPNRQMLYLVQFPLSNEMYKDMALANDYMNVDYLTQAFHSAFAPSMFFSRELVDFSANVKFLNTGDSEFAIRLDTLANIFGTYREDFAALRVPKAAKILLAEKILRLKRKAGDKAGACWLNDILLLDAFGLSKVYMLCAPDGSFGSVFSVLEQPSERLELESP